MATLSQLGAAQPAAPTAPTPTPSVRPYRDDQFATPTPAGSLARLAPTPNAATGGPVGYTDTATGAYTPSGGDNVTTYGDQFRQSLADARSHIQEQLKAALAETARQEQMANQQLGLLPGQLQALYNPAAAQLGQLGKQANAAVAAAGISPGAGNAAAMAPLQGALSLGNTFNQQNVPILQMGLTDLFARQRGALNQAGMSAGDELGREERDYLRQEQQNQEERAGRREDIQTQADIERETNRQNLQAQNDALRQQAAMRDAPLNAPSAADYGRGEYLKTYSPDEYNRIVNSKEYQDAEAQVGTKRRPGVLHIPGKDSRRSPESVAKDLEKRGLHRTAAIFRYRHGLGKPKPQAAPAGQ